MAAGERTSIPIVDAHHHVWDPGVRAQPWLDSDEALAPLRRKFTAADLAPVAAEAGVTTTVVVQTVTEPTETPELLALARTGQLVAAVVGWTDLTHAGAGDAIAELRAAPGGEFLAGMRHPLLTEPDPDWLARRDVRRGLAALAAAGLTFDLVLQPDQLASAVQAAAATPELIFVLDHLGNVDVTAGPTSPANPMPSANPIPPVDTVPDQAWAAAFTALAALPNTVCKLSGILGEAPVERLRPYFDLALAAFGPHRLMFGSDWPVCTLQSSYRDVLTRALALTARLSEPEQAAIMSGTARAVYHMQQPAGRGGPG
jgi:L-fuconolactonase